MLVNHILCNAVLIASVCQLAKNAYMLLVNYDFSVDVTCRLSADNMASADATVLHADAIKYDTIQSLGG